MEGGGAVRNRVARKFNLPVGYGHDTVEGPTPTDSRVRPILIDGHPTFEISLKCPPRERCFALPSADEAFDV